jgi:hypothetical protein
MSICCPCCKNKVERKGKTLFIENDYFVDINGKKICLFENDHVCCICLTNDKNAWIKMDGCTCVNSPGHKECMSTYFYIVLGIKNMINDINHELTIDQLLELFQSQTRNRSIEFRRRSIIEVSNLDEFGNAIYTEFIINKIRACYKLLDFKNLKTGHNKMCLYCNTLAEQEAFIIDEVINGYMVKPHKAFLCKKICCRWLHILNFPKFEYLKKAYPSYLNHHFDPCKRYISRTYELDECKIQINKILNEYNQTNNLRHLIILRELIKKTEKLIKIRKEEYDEDFKIYEDEYYG